jgi:beta-lactamase regulating signal transducer with metallopeptidase domain
MILLPSAFLGLLPFLAAHTMLVNGLPDFALTIGNRTITDFHTDLNGDPVAQSSLLIWIVAVIGEIMLLTASVLRPTKVNSNKINIRG